MLGGRNASTSRCGPYFGGNSSDRCATLSVPGCGVADLNTLLDSSGPGWLLWEAAGIDDAHQIVANGLSPVDGAEHAVLLTRTTCHSVMGSERGLVSLIQISYETQAGELPPFSRKRINRRQQVGPEA